VGSATYALQVNQIDRPDWEFALRSALDDEMKALGIHKSVRVVVGSTPPTSEPAVGVYLGSPAAARHPGCIAMVDAALSRLQLIVPSSTT
jgi:hypothetical protein